MRRSAAGSAGGRPAVQQRRAGPGGRGGHRGTAACAVAAGLIAVPLVGLGPPAAAAPGDPPPVAEDETGDSTRPVQVDVTRFEPRTLVPGTPVTISGTLTNTGTETLTDLDVRLQRGEVLTTRAGLQATDGDPDPMTAAATPFQEVPGELEPGDSARFALTTDAGQLQIERDGVYPVLLNLNGAAADGERRRLGELSTFLVQPPAQPAAAPSVAWLWPLVERTHRDAAGRFVDDGLAAEVAPDGRLDRALAAVEQLPETTPPEGGEGAPVVPVTLAVDPALVEELEVMADGPYDVAGQDDAGRGSEDAAAFLDRLRAVAADHAVLALPYGDVDADSLTAAGLSGVVTRSLPGTPEGSAQDDPDAPVPADETTTEEPAAPVDEADDADDGTGAGTEILRDALEVEPRTDLAWAGGGAVRADTLATLRQGGVDEVVVASGALTGGADALGLGGRGAAARTTVPAADGVLDALVADAGLGGLVGAAAQVPGGTRLAEQRYLAELALLALQPTADPAAGQTVLVAPPREVDVEPTGMSALLAAAGQLPWLRPATVAQLGDGPATATGELAPATGGLDSAGLADVRAAVGVRDALAQAIVGDAAAALAPSDAAISRTSSAAWREDPAAFGAAAVDLRATLGDLREQVTLLSPAEGTYSLASSNAPLVLTVRNDLPFSVRVLLRLQTRGNAALTVEDIGETVLAPDQRTTLQVPTEVRQSGRFAVVATLTTPDGAPLGEPVQLQVRSTVYGSISLITTIGAAALLGLLFLRRLVLFVLRRRRGAPAEDGAGGPAPEGAAIAVPPTRSPV